MLYQILRFNRLAVAGTIAVGIVIALANFGVVRAEHAKPNASKNYACNGPTACVEGDSTGSNTWGVYGSASIADGVHGVTAGAGSSGVSGISTGTAHGVYGKSSNGQGVYGTSVSSNGVEGHTSLGNGSGVAGYGVSSPSGVGIGVYGYGSYGVTGEGQSVGVAAQGDGTYGMIFYGYDPYTGGACIMDDYSNLQCNGTITGGAEARVRQVSSNGQRVLAYAPESASATIEDVGTARMAEGVANVPIDRAFASTIDRNTPYHVFLTPDGDTRGLYVSVKTPSGFEVREAQGGRSTVSFDYRIVARPLGERNDRLPPAPALPKMPTLTHRPH
jgi:hypothetical protein